MTDNEVNQSVRTKPPQFFLKIIALYSNLEILDIHVIVVVLSSLLVSSPTVGELTVTDEQQQLSKNTKKAFYTLQ